MITLTQQQITTSAQGTFIPAGTLTPTTPSIRTSPLPGPAQRLQLPISPISGQPIHTSIFQPYDPSAYAPTLVTSSPDALILTPPSTSGPDANTWLVLLVVLAAVLVMVLG
jgi:hypothetical protein